MQKTKQDFKFVGLQILLFIAYLFRIPALNFEISNFWQIAGFSMAVLGALMTMISILQLKSSLSIFPSPKAGGVLIESGLYRYFRHPIYSGIILCTLSFAFASLNGWRLIITVLLFILFYFKARYEEKRLIQVFPEYEEYQKKSWMFFPGV